MVSDAYPARSGQLSVTRSDVGGVRVVSLRGELDHAAHRAAQDAQGWLRVAGARQSVRRVIELVGVDALIPCRPTLRQALEG
ncbi:hypothetical protein ACFW9L_00265 [Streptomyces sp. NPDC059517]|uniref:hypothetical protein n=1 Tax=Streptomyces sp. NPDC059517 TaxID=3346855 RepID=UPI0036C0F74D